MTRRTVLNMSLNVDSRGVLRGRCTFANCTCDGYSTVGGSLKCTKCSHPPGRHANLSQPAATTPTAQGYGGSSHGVGSQSYAQAAASGSGTTPTQSTYYQQQGNGVYHQSHGYGYGYMSQWSPPNLSKCQADGCTNPVHYEPDVGAFDYCSPECRDRHLLPIHQEQLKSDLEEMTQQLRTMRKTIPSADPKLLKLSVKKQPGEDLGLIVGERTHVSENVHGLLITGVEVKRNAFKRMEQKGMRLLDVIVQVTKQGVTTPLSFEDEILRSFSSFDIDVHRGISLPHSSKLFSEASKLAYSYPHATHIVALRPSSHKDFGLTIGEEYSKVVVRGVSENTPARQCRLKFGDIILKYALASDKEIEALKTAEKEKLKTVLAEASRSSAQKTLVLIISRKST